MGSKNLNLSEILNRLNAIHPNLSFPKIFQEFKNTESRITVLCPTHGEYSSSIDNLIYSKSTCKSCRNDNTKTRYLIKVKDHPLVKKVLEKYRLKTPDLECNSITRLEFICQDHGSFFKTIKGMSRNNNFDCKKCKIDQKKPLQYYLDKMNEKYNGNYTYSIIPPYTGANTRLNITCHKHGTWDCFIYNHLHNNTDCPKCSGIVSKGSLELYQYILQFYPKAESEIRLGRYRPDIVIEEKKLIIEYLGDYFHSSKFLDKYAHRDKRRYFNNLGYRVIFIWEHEWKNSLGKVKDYLNAQFGIGTKIYARNCSIVEVSKEVGKSFIEENHLMGSGIVCTRYIGLEVLGELVACVGFRKVFNNYELYRAAYLSNFRIVGGLSKILTYFIKSSSVTELISYIDMDKFDGRSYFKSGFKAVEESLSMNYVKRDKVISRHKMKKGILLKQYPDIDSNLTEKQICENLKIYQCWNSGTLKVSLTNTPSIS